MSDEQREVSFEEALVNRMATRLGVAAAQIEMLQLQLEQALQENERLREQIPKDMEPPVNGEAKAWQSTPSM